MSNQQITASSTHRALFGLQKWYPYYARLNKKGLVNAWTAAENDRWPWIQVTDGAEEKKISLIQLPESLKELMKTSGNLTARFFFTVRNVA